MIHYECPHCGHKLAIPEKYGGTHGQCNNCAGVIMVPLPMSDSEPTFESDRGNRIIPEPLLYGAALIGGLVILLVMYSLGIRFISNFAEGVETLIDLLIGAGAVIAHGSVR
jgi:hypothetical protein